MVNKRRGEIAAELDGKQWKLCLTLGALAELESAFDAADLVALGARFSSGKLSAKDMIAVITAGLRGGGHEVETSNVSNMQADGGLTQLADIVVRLLSATFGESTPTPNP